MAATAGAQVAGSLDHDVASLLGYSLQPTTPQKIEPVRSTTRNDSGESAVAVGFTTETAY